MGTHIVIHPRYHEAFGSLTPEEVHCVVENLLPAHPELSDLGDFEEGTEVLQFCTSSHISHAEVILSLRNDPRVSAVTALERLMMRPIDRRTPAQVERERDAARPRPQVVAAGVGATSKSDARVIRVLVERNPKRPGTSAHERFARYADGMTVADALSQGITTGDLKWDQERGFVRIEAVA